MTGDGLKSGAWRWWLALALLLVVGALVVGGSVGAAGSSLSAEARGWLAARRYLEARGARVELRDRPLTEIEGAVPGVLVLAFPWQHHLAEGEVEAVGKVLRGGGTVLVAYSGEAGQHLEATMLDALRLETAALREPAPLGPLAWWKYHREVWSLAPEASWTGEAPGPEALELAALQVAPRAPRRSRVLYRGPEGEPLVFTYPLHRGRVVALPAPLLANAWIHRGGNADLLETLLGWLGEVWSFDEYHHALVAADAVPSASSSFAWDLFIVHLGLVYLLGLVALGRRFGPAWRDAPEAVGSTSAFLRNLGSLHSKLRHHRDAARLLRQRARAYDPDLAFSDDPDEPLEVRDDRGLVQLARKISRVQRRRNS